MGFKVGGRFGVRSACGILTCMVLSYMAGLGWWLVFDSWHGILLLIGLLSGWRVFGFWLGLGLGVYGWSWSGFLFGWVIARFTDSRFGVA